MSLTPDAVLSWLEANSSPEVRSGMARYGIPDDRAFGLAMREMKSYAKRVGPSHDLALQLWDTGWYEARTVAVFVAELDSLTSAQMDSWASDFDNWAICDTACFHLFDRSPLAWEKVPQWARAEREFERRAAFALLWGLSVHDRSAEDAQFISAMRWIENGAQDDRLYVKKGVNMALRAIGKRNRRLHAAARDLAAELAAEEEPTPRWIGKHALRELRSDRVRRRLRD